MERKKVNTFSNTFWFSTTGSYSFTTENYSKFLVSLKKQVVLTNVPLSARGGFNQDAIEARSYLINTMNWSINDGGLSYYPDSVYLYEPKSGDNNVELNPSFKWRCSINGVLDDMGNCYKHQIQLLDSGSNIAIDSTFELSAMDADTLVFNPRITLEHKSDYKWRIKSKNESGWSQWSDYSSFTTRAQLEVNNLTIINEDSLHVTDHKPTFNYEYISGDGSTQNSFQFQVTTDSLFETITHWNSGFIETDSTIFSYSGDSLIDGTSYYSRLRDDYRF